MNDVAVMPKSLPAFRVEAAAAFKRANPDAADVKIEWLRSNRVRRWADGSAGFSGSFIASATGYSARTVQATWCRGMMVR